MPRKRTGQGQNVFRFTRYGAPGCAGGSAPVQPLVSRPSSQDILPLPGAFSGPRSGIRQNSRIRCWSSNFECHIEHYIVHACTGLLPKHSNANLNFSPRPEIRLSLSLGPDLRGTLALDEQAASLAAGRRQAPQLTVLHHLSRIIRFQSSFDKFECPHSSLPSPSMHSHVASEIP
jgi:hypothetical protein